MKHEEKTIALHRTAIHKFETNIDSEADYETFLTTTESNFETLGTSHLTELKKLCKLHRSLEGKHNMLYEANKINPTSMLKILEHLL